MTYTKYPWTAGKTTPINATNLNHIEDGIYDAHEMATGRGATFVIAANDSSDQDKRQADYVCPGSNDHVTIQSAIDALSGSGKDIFFTKGNYAIDDINAVSNLILRGCGVNTIFTGGEFNVASKSDVRISDIKINAPAKSYVVDVRDSSYVNILDCTLIGGTDDTVNLRESTHTKVIRCDVSGATETGIEVEGSHYVTLSQNTISDSQYGVTIQANIGGQTPPHHVSVIDSYIYDCDHGVKPNCTLGDISQLLISHNHIYNSGYGISADHMKYSSISENTFTTLTEDAIALTTGVYGTSITDNIFDAITKRGMRINSAANKLIIGTNVFGTCSYAPIELSGSVTDILIGNNMFDSTNGIWLKDTGMSNINISNNEFVGNSLSAQGTLTSPYDISGIIIQNNIGYVTKNSGTATLANGTTSIAVTHGLAATPTAGDIIITPIEAWGAMTEFYIDTYTSTQFTIHGDQDPTQDVDFAWKAIVL